MDPSRPPGVKRCCVGKVREEGNCVTAKSTSSSGGKQVVMSHQCEAEELQLEPRSMGRSHWINEEETSGLRLG